MKKLKLIIIPLFMLLFLGCQENTSKTELSKVHFDRDMCARCVMVVSDRHHTLQVKNPQTGKAYMFDDIGCLSIWFEEEKPQWRKNALIWITDSQSGEFIDAKKAYYTTTSITPMAFGFSAHKSKKTIKQDEEVIGFDEVMRRSIILNEKQ